LFTAVAGRRVGGDAGTWWRMRGAAFWGEFSGWRRAGGGDGGPAILALASDQDGLPRLIYRRASRRLSFLRWLGVCVLDLRDDRSPASFFLQHPVAIEVMVFLSTSPVNRKSLDGLWLLLPRFASLARDRLLGCRILDRLS
jgi:hypothetical protein